MAFSRQPRPIGRLSIRPGSLRNDSITGLGGEAWFTGKGDDRLTGTRTTRNEWVLPAFLSGGRGNDRYSAKRGSFTVISDQGGGRDVVDLSALSPLSTFFVKLNRGVIGIVDDQTLVAIHKPFKGKKSKIESVIFNGRSWSPRQLYKFGASQGASLGSSTFEELERIGFLNFSILGLNSSDTGIRSIISAAEFNSSIVS
jgi:hypothetical protein